jgi:uncharacterized protein involved in type VI secretion and phage assembly
MMSRAAPDCPPLPPTAHCHLGEVVRVDDPDDRARVQVRLYAYDGIGAQDAAVWARVAVPFAGNQSGAFLFPNVGDEVLVAFAGGDPRQPVVVGSLWNGKDKPKERLGGSGDRIDRWTIVGRNGTRVAVVEEQSGQEKIELSTPSGVKATLTEESGGQIKLETAGCNITIKSSEVTIESSNKVTVDASQVSISAGKVDVDSAMATFSGIVRCDTLQATAVVSATYTTGAGNVL